MGDNADSANTLTIFFRVVMFFLSLACLLGFSFITGVPFSPVFRSPLLWIEFLSLFLFLIFALISKQHPLYPLVAWVGFEVTLFLSSTIGLGL